MQKNTRALWQIFGGMVIGCLFFLTLALIPGFSKKKPPAENIALNDEKAWAAMFENNIRSFPSYTIFVLKTGEVAIFEGMTDICVRYSQMHGYKEVEIVNFSRNIQPKGYFFPDVSAQEKQRAYLLERFIRNERVPNNWDKAVK